MTYGKIEDWLDRKLERGRRYGVMLEGGYHIHCTLIKRRIEDIVQLIDSRGIPILFVEDRKIKEITFCKVYRKTNYCDICGTAYLRDY